MTASSGEQRLRCSVLGSMPPSRGISSYCLELVRALAALANVEVIAFKKMYPSFLYPGGKSDDDRTFPSVERPGLTVRRKLTYYNPFTWLWEGLRGQGEVLHAQWWSPPLAPIYLCILLLFRLRGKRVVLTVHDVIPHEGGWASLMATRLLCWLANAIVVHCESNRDALVRRLHVAPDKVSCFPHGPLSFLTESSVPRAEARARLGLLPEHRVVLNFGAIRDYKGIDVLLHAFARVHQAVPNARLVIAGRLWSDWAPFQAIIDKHHLGNAVTLCLDYIPSNQVAPLFDAADLVVLPYKWFDSQSGAAMAAIPFAKPLIVSRVGGLPELVTDPSQVIEPGDHEGLASAILACLTDPQRLAAMAAGSAEIARRFSWSEIARQTVALYESVLRRRHEPHGN